MQHKIGSSPLPCAESSRTSPALRALHVAIASCTICPSLKPWRQFGPDAYGNPSTGYALVGEAPGYVSWKQRRRLTGPAGMLIRRALRRVGHPRYRDLEDLFYMTDVVKCHPSPPGKPASNRSPRRAEADACSTHLVRELQTLRPSTILVFGKVAAEGVAKAVALAAGNRFPAPKVMAFPHPSPRNQRTILTRYRSMRAFEQALAGTFRNLIAELEAPKERET